MSFLAFVWYAVCALFWLSILLFFAAVVLGVLTIRSVSRDVDQDPYDDYKG